MNIYRPLKTEQKINGNKSWIGCDEALLCGQCPPNPRGKMGDGGRAVSGGIDKLSLGRVGEKRVAANIRVLSDHRFKIRDRFLDRNNRKNDPFVLKMETAAYRSKAHVVEWGRAKKDLT